ncbi:thioredoxin family protein [bacterium]|jgi:predicted thioredoxin/glutaredoxin|nr:thioredoxin family protein [bacterium]
MKIEILGVGCPKCQKLYENVRQAVEQSGVDAEIVKVTKISDISNYNVMLTPALVIDGEVKTSGTIPPVSEIEKWIKGQVN